MIFDLTIFFIDGFNRKTTRSFMVDTVDHPTAVAAAASFVSFTAPMSRCGITKWRLSQDTDFATVIVPGANKDAGLTMIWELGVLGSGKLAATKLPAPFDNFFDSNGILILDVSAVEDYTTEMLLGAIKISDGEQAVALIKGSLDK